MKKQKTMNIIAVVLAVVVVLFSVPLGTLSAEGNPDDNYSVTFAVADMRIQKDAAAPDLLAGVTAVDENDQQLPVSILDDGGFDVTIANDYTVTYAATHPQLGQQTKQVTVTVYELADGGGSGGFVYDAQPQDAAEVQAALGAFLADPLGNPFPRWQYAIDDAWLPTGFVLAEHTDADTGQIYYQLQLWGGIVTTADDAPGYKTVTNEKELQEACLDTSIHTVIIDNDFSIGGSYAIDVSNYNLQPIVLPARNLTIEGGGNTLTLVSGYTGRHMVGDFANYVTTIKNLTLQGHNTGVPTAANLASRLTGGGINYSGFSGKNSNLVLDNSTIRDCHASTGGALYNINAIHTLKNGSQLINNSATENGGAYYHNNAELQVYNSTISNNYAGGSGGGILANYAQRTPGITLENSTLSNNGATGYGGAVSTLYGGCSISATGTTFSNNTASQAGAIYAQSGYQLTITRCNFTNNEATTSSAGAVWHSSGGTTGTVITDSNFTGNKAAQNGGAVFSSQPPLTISGGSFINNTAGGYGGAIYNPFHDRLYVDGSTFSGNVAAAGYIYWKLDDPKSFVANGENQHNEASYYLANILNVNTVSQKPATAPTQSNHLFNNYDIYYNPTFSVWYLATADTVWMQGGVQITPNRSATQHNTYVGNGTFAEHWTNLDIELLRPGYRHIGWQVVTQYTPDYGTGNIPIGEDGVYIYTSSGTNIIPASTMLTGPLVLGTSWIAVKPLTYHANNGSGASVEDGEYYRTENVDVKDISDVDGSWTAPSAGETFAGWATTPAPVAGETLYNENDLFSMPDTATDLYARWTVSRTVTFDSQGGSNTAPMTNVPDGSLIQAPARPTKGGYVFIGWYKEAACQNKWDFATDTVDSDMTLYAGWVLEPVAKYEVVYYGNGATGGIIPQTVSNPFDTVIRVPAGVPTREGYEFIGWRASFNGVVYQPGSSFNMPAQDIRMVAQWRAVDEMTKPPEPETTIPGIIAPPIPLDPPSKDEAVIDEDDIPMAGGKSHWALVNLILVILAVGATVVEIVRNLIDRSRNDGEESAVGPLRKIGIPLAAIASAVLFLLTEDLSLPMVLTDKWTIPMALLPLVQLVLVLIGKRDKGEEE